MLNKLFEETPALAECRGDFSSPGEGYTVHGAAKTRIVKWLIFLLIFAPRLISPLPYNHGVRSRLNGRYGTFDNLRVRSEIRSCPVERPLTHPCLLELFFCVTSLFELSVQPAFYQTSANQGTLSVSPVFSVPDIRTKALIQEM